MPPPLWSPKRDRRLLDLKSFTPTVRTAVSALATSSSYTTSASKSYGIQGAGEREPCTTLTKRPFRLQRLTQASWSCQSAGWSSVPTRGLNAGAVRSCITTANWISRPPGYGWPRRVCYSIDLLIKSDRYMTAQRSPQSVRLNSHGVRTGKLAGHSISVAWPRLRSQRRATSAGRSPRRRRDDHGAL